MYENIYKCNKYMYKKNSRVLDKGNSSEFVQRVILTTSLFANVEISVFLRRNNNQTN